MKAFEAKIKAIPVQYKEVIAKIHGFINDGKSKGIISDLLLFDEVLEMILNKGYDVVIVKENKNSKNIICYEFHFSHAMEGRIGNKSYIYRDE